MGDFWLIVVTEGNGDETEIRCLEGLGRADGTGYLRIPTEPATYSDLKAATYSDPMPAGVPI